MRVERERQREREGGVVAPGSIVPEVMSPAAATLSSRGHKLQAWWPGKYHLAWLSLFVLSLSVSSPSRLDPQHGREYVDTLLSSVVS